MNVNTGERKDAIRLAQGLFESKVSVSRPPTHRQKATFNMTRHHTAAPSLKTQKYTREKASSIRYTSADHQQAPPTSWRPFTGAKSLSKSKKICQHKAVPTPVNNDTRNEVCPPQLDEKPRVPQGIGVFEPWICEDNLEPWTGVPSDKNCFVLLPNGFEDFCDYLPPLQGEQEPLLERPDNKYIAPRILHNYNYLETESFYDCDHSRKPRTTDERSPERLRTSEIIKQEIEDLEKLLRGQGNPHSSSIVNRYQHEITTLKQMVVDTLREYNIMDRETMVRDDPSESTILQGDLFQFLARHDEVIAVIRQKRDACIQELARLEKKIHESMCT